MKFEQNELGKVQHSAILNEDSMNKKATFLFANTKACQISPDSDFVFENQALEIGCETTCFVYLAAVAARLRIVGVRSK